MTIADQVRRVIAQHLWGRSRHHYRRGPLPRGPGADSLDAFELLMAFEETFSIEIPYDAADQRCSTSATPSPTSKRKSPRAAHAGGVVW